jgi:serine/threonine-protein phosphatase 2A regulatory subunit A
VDILLYFAKGLGPDFLLNERNGKIYFELLKDRVFAVRKRAIESLRNLIDIYGTQWFEKNMVPKIVTFQKINNYLQREIFIFAVEAIAGAVSLDCLQKQLVPLLLTMTSDPVENIRYNSAKTLGVVAKFLKDLEPIRRTIKPLKEDKDIDVRTIAAKVER